MTHTPINPLRNPLLRNAFAAGVNQIANLVPILLTPLLAKRLGLDLLGVTAVALSLIQLSFVITDFGYTLSTTHRIAKNKSNTQYINKIISNVAIGKVPLTLISILATMGFPIVSEEYSEHWLLFILSSIAILGQSYQMSWLFQGLEKMKTVTGYMVATKLLYLAFVVIFVQSPSDAYLVIAGWGAAQLSAALLSLRSTFRAGYHFRRVSIGDVLEEAKIAASFFLSRLAVATYTSVTTIFAGLSGQQQAACFYTCQQIYKIGAALPINQVLYPYMAKNRNWKVFYLTTLAAGGILTIMAILACVHSKNIVLALLGPNIPGAELTLMVLIAATVLSYFAVTFGYPALCAVDALDKANLSVILASIVNLAILLSLYLTEMVSAFTTAASILATELCVLSLRIFYLFKAKKCSL